MAFILAFSFNMTSDRFNEHMTLLVREVNLLKRVYLNGIFWKQDEGDRARELIAEYLDLRDFYPFIPLSP
ncbi:hypothetical protein ACJJIX_06450 [Microbulbifer sp. VAAC004]|uniref:hypothetical protein n=1 Tax=unclassified Microbulbifer TaxID=2619833 RepID=UPI0040395DDF